jgi:hypothetical protein
LEDRRILEHDAGFTDEVHVRRIADEFRVGFRLVD